MSQAQSDRNRLLVVFRRIVREPDEKKVRAIIARDLELPEGTPEHEHLLKKWHECCRESEGWQVT